MRLNDPLTTSFIYDNKKYKIDLSFDNVLDVFDVIEDKTLRDYEKIDIALEMLLFEPITHNKEGLWEYIYENHIASKREQVIEYDLQGNPIPIMEEEESDEIPISFDKDAPHIYASFRQAYGINLINEQGKMHWEEFKALLFALPEDTMIKKIIHIRTWQPTKGDSPEYTEQMKKLKKIWSINRVE